MENEFHKNLAGTQDLDGRPSQLCQPVDLVNDLGKANVYTQMGQGRTSFM